MTRGRRRLLAAVLAVVMLAAIAGVAVATWTPAATSGPGAAAAASVAAGATPTATVSPGRAVTVAWAATTLSDGAPVDGYLVQRYDATSGTLAAVGIGCTGTITTTSCVEAAVPPGSWRYTVTPVVGLNWRGAESARSGIATIGAATLTLAATQFGGPAPFPRTTSGTITGFAANEGVTYRLDAATPLTGTPAAVGPAGTIAVTSLSIPAVADGAHTVWAIGNAGVPSQASAAIVVDRTAPTAGAAVAPAPNGAGWNTTAPVAVTLTANDGAGVGGGQIRYTTDGTDPTVSGTAQTYAAPLSLNTTTTVRFAASDALGNTSAVGSQTVRIDTGAPANGLSLTNVTGGAFLAGTTVWYRGAAAGSFTIANALTDAGSGPASSATAALGGTTTGWAHVPGTVATPAGGPYTSAAFTWGAGTASAPTDTVTGADVAGNVAATALTFANDIAGPAGGSVDAAGLGGTGARYSASTTLSIAFAKGADPQSGLAATGARLLRATATLTSAGGTADGVCGAYGAFAQVGANDPVSPVSNAVGDRACYRYQYAVTDNVGNTTTYTSPDIKVDTTAPSTPALTPGAQTGDTAITGSTVYINPQSGHSGTFQIAAVTTDLDSGIQKVAFPALAGFLSGGGDDLTSPYATTYSWGAGATATGAQAVTATSNAAVASPAATFSVVADTAAPAGGALSVNGVAATAGGSTSTASSTTFPIDARTDYTEATGATASGLASSTLVREQATLAGGICGTTWTGATTIAGNPGQGAPAIVSGSCYRYTLTGTDRVGNAVSLSTIVQVDTSAPTLGAPALTLGASGPYAFVSGTTAYYNGATGAGSAITVNAPNVSDPQSGIARVTFPALAGFAGGGDDLTSPYGASYTWSAGTAAGTQTVTAVNGTGLTAASTFALVRDVTAPTGGALTVNGVLASGAGSSSVNTTGAFTIGARTDWAETLGPASAGLAASVLVRDQATLSGATCGAFSGAVTLTGAPAQSGLTTGCWRYTLTGTDAVGNAVSVSTTVKVDTSVPVFGAPALTLGATGPYAFVAGTTAYYNGAVGTGSSLTVTAPTVADADSGIAQVAFPALAGFAGGGADLVSPFSATYTWAAATAAGTQTATATNGTGLTAAASFSLVRDVTAPAGGALTVNGLAATGAGSSSSASVPSFTIGVRTDYTETQSAAAAGLASSTLVRDQTPLTGTACGTTFTNPTTISGTPVQNAAAGIVAGTCYRYTLTGTDNVGNATSVSTTVRVSRLTATNIVLANGGRAGRPGTNDTITITYSDVVDASSFCSTWVNGSPQSLLASNLVVITITNVGASDTITAATTSGCTFHLGTVDTNADYVSATATYTGVGTNASELDWDPVARTLTLVLGTRTSGARNTNVPQSIPDYTPDPLIDDLNGVTIAPGPFTGTLSGF